MENLNVKTSETIGIEEVLNLKRPYVLIINNAVQNLTKKWVYISQVLYEAKKELTSKEYKYLRDCIDLDASTINKLLKIPQSNFITSNMERFEKVKSWVVLHKIALMSEEEQSEVLKIPHDRSITLREINEIKKKFGVKISRYPNVKITGSPFIEIRLDTKNIDNPDVISDIEERITEFVSEINCKDVNLTMVSNDLSEKFAQKLEVETEREMKKMDNNALTEIKKVVRDFYNAEIKKFPCKSKHKSKMAKVDQFTEKFGLTPEIEMFGSDDAYVFAANYLALEDSLSTHAKTICSSWV